jgi:hypothetical protein
MNDNQNAYQNAGQNGNFYYTAIANQSSTFLVLILALILLFAYLGSERRYRSILEELVAHEDCSEEDCAACKCECGC